MHEYQWCTDGEIQSRLETLNYWLRIHSNKLLCKLQSQKPAKIVKDGVSEIVTYYDEHLNYLCTIHRVNTSEGQTIHENVKDAVIGGIWYRAKSPY